MSFNGLSEHKEKYLVEKFIKEKVIKDGKGQIFGSSVPTGYLSDIDREKFHIKYPDYTNDQFEDPDFAPEFNNRLLKPKDIDIFFPKSVDMQIFLDELKDMPGFKKIEYGPSNYTHHTLFDEYYEVFTGKLHYEYGRSFQKKGKIIKIHLDLVVPKKQEMTFPPTFLGMDVSFKLLTLSSNGIQRGTTNKASEQQMFEAVKILSELEHGITSYRKETWRIKEMIMEILPEAITSEDDYIKIIHFLRSRIFEITRLVKYLFEYEVKGLPLFLKKSSTCCICMDDDKSCLAWDKECGGMCLECFKSYLNSFIPKFGEVNFVYHHDDEAMEFLRKNNEVLMEEVFHRFSKEQILLANKIVYSPVRTLIEF